MINIVTDDPRRDGILQVDWYANAVKETYKDQDDMVNCIQEKWELLILLGP